MNTGKRIRLSRMMDENSNRTLICAYGSRHNVWSHTGAYRYARNHERYAPPEVRMRWLCTKSLYVSAILQAEDAQL